MKIYLIFAPNSHLVNEKIHFFHRNSFLVFCSKKDLKVTVSLYFCIILDNFEWINLHGAKKEKNILKQIMRIDNA